MREIILFLENLIIIFRQEQSSILTSLLATLSAIRKEKDPDSSLVEEKATIVKRLLAEVELGVEEAQMMAQLASHLSSLEGDRAKLKAQVRASNSRLL